MKLQEIIILLLFIGLLDSCRQAPDCELLYKNLEEEFNKGNFSKVKELDDSIRKSCPSLKELIHRSDSLNEIGNRIMVDFSLSEDRLNEQLKIKTGSWTPEEKAKWGKNNWLESRLINGQKRYFNRAASNFLLIRSFHENRAERDSLEATDREIVERKAHTQSIMKLSQKSSDPVLPVNLTINYTLTVDADAVPEGKTVRCWLPFPKENNLRQKEVKLISASSEDYVIAPDSVLHRTIYMEANAQKGAPLIFRVSYSYQSSGQYFDPDQIKSMPFDKNSLLYRKYTAEQMPHICFTEKVMYVADSITGSETNPVEIVRKVYKWFSTNIPWAGALEYSIMPNIPDYVLTNRRGDCGMQTFLMMSILRYKGIPVRWQSGWKVPQDAKNLHDWCEVYFEGTGWVPLDVSYGLQYSDNIKTREFFITGIDSYRLIINDGVAGKLFPQKRFLRSEPFDFQRGEVEWEGGNLYFDKWDYDMEIIYNK